jgi:DNA mismatch endonuclease (patch repair protein)
MSRIGPKDTKPELEIRRLLFRQGLRFRLNDKRLPGTPDVVLRRYWVALFVHGCFWHRHRGCRFAYSPKTNVRFWNEKFAKNVERDLRNARELRTLVRVHGGIDTDRGM